MAEAVSPDVVVYVCANCTPESARLPHQWTRDGARVLVRQVPCSGKIDGQYLLHGLEAGARGVAVVTCPKGECQLGQGNLRAEVRIGTIRRLLGEIGVEPERAELVHCHAQETYETLERRVHDVADRLCRLGPSPLGSPRAEVPAGRGSLPDRAAG